MTDSPAPSPCIRSVCPKWRSPLFRVVHDGIEIKCKSCRGGVHHITRESLEQAWAELAKAQQGAIFPEKPVS